MAEEKKTVLLVDDEPDARAFAEAIVSEVDDFRIITADNGEDGLELAKKEIPDLMVLDVMMPKKDGFAVFNALRSDPATEGIPVIMLTGVSSETGIKFSGEAMGQFFGRKPEAFIDKPLDPVKLQEAVKSALGL